MTPEVKVQSKITSFLKNEINNGKGLYYEKRQALGVQYKKGVPDIWFVMNGRHFEIEVKRPGGSRSALQEKYEKIFVNAGVIYACVDSFEKFLEIYNAYR